LGSNSDHITNLEAGKLGFATLANTKQKINALNGITIWPRGSAHKTLAPKENRQSGHDGSK